MVKFGLFSKSAPKGAARAPEADQQASSQPATAPSSSQAVSSAATEGATGKDEIIELLRNGDDSGVEKWRGRADLKDDRDIALALCKRHGIYLKELSESLRADTGIVEAAVDDDWHAFEHAAGKAREDVKIMLLTIRKSKGKAFEKHPEFHGNKEVVLEALREADNATTILSHASSDLRADFEVVFAAFKKHPEAVKYAEQNIREDRNLVMKLFQEASSFTDAKERKSRFLAVVTHTSETLHGKVFQEDDEKLLLEVFGGTGPRCLDLATTAVKGSKSIMTNVCQLNSEGLAAASQSLKVNREFIVGLLNSAEGETKNIYEIYDSVVKHCDPDSGENLRDKLFSMEEEALILQIFDHAGARVLPFATIDVKANKDTMTKVCGKQSLKFKDQDVSQQKNALKYVLDQLDDSLKSDHSFVLNLVETYSYTALSAALAWTELISHDEEIAFAACKRDISLFGSLGEGVKTNRKFVIDILNHHWLLVNSAGDKSWEKSRKETVLALLFGGRVTGPPEREFSQGLDEKLRGKLFDESDKANDLLLKILDEKKHDTVLAWATTSVKENAKTMVQVLKRDKPGRDATLKHASERLKNDIGFIVELIKLEPLRLEWAHVNLKSNPDVVRLAVENVGTALKFASDALKADFEIALTAVKQDGHALEFASDALKENDVIALAAVKKDGQALVHVADALKQPVEDMPESNLKIIRDIALAAVKQHVSALDHVHPDFKSDKQFVMSLLEKYPLKLEWADRTLQGDPEVVIEAVTKDSNALRFAFQTHKTAEKMLQATMIVKVADDPVSFKVLAKDVKRNKELVTRMLQKNGKVLQHVGKSFKDDRDMVLAAVMSAAEEDEVWKYASRRLGRKDKDNWLAAAWLKKNHVELQRILTETWKGTTNKAEDKAFISERGRQENRDHKKSEADGPQITRDEYKRLVLLALKAHGGLLKFVWEELKRDTEVVETAVNSEGTAIQFAAEELKIDNPDDDGFFELAKAAVRNDGQAFLHLPKQLQEQGQQGFAGYISGMTWQEKHAELALNALLARNGAVTDDTKLRGQLLRNAGGKKAVVEKAKAAMQVIDMSKKDRDATMTKIKAIAEYDCWSVMFDSILPVCDYNLDLYSLYNFWASQQKYFFSSVTSAMIANTLATTYLMHDTHGYRWYDMLLNCVTLGIYGMCKESQRCSYTGEKSELLLTMKVFEAMESAMSFMVNVYALMLAFEGDEPPDHGVLTARYCSIATSLITLPMASNSYVVTETKQKKFGESFANHVEWCGFSVMFFSVTEIWMAINLMILQLIFRPFGAFIALGIFAHNSMLMYLGSNTDEFKAFLQTLISMMFNLLPPSKLNLRLTILRFYFQVGVIAAVAVGLLLHPKVVEHLLKPEVLPLTLMAAAGCALHPLAILQQWWAYRWSNIDFGFDSDEDDDDWDAFEWTRDGVEKVTADEKIKLEEPPKEKQSVTKVQGESLKHAGKRLDDLEDEGWIQETKQVTRSNSDLKAKSDNEASVLGRLCPCIFAKRPEEQRELTRPLVDGDEESDEKFMV